MYGPVCTVVGQGSAGDRRPYADQYLRKAMSVLEDGQITVHNHQPRQLVPLRLEQISREEWAIDVDDGDLRPEDDDQ